MQPPTHAPVPVGSADRRERAHHDTPDSAHGHAPVALVADHDATALTVVSDALRREGFAVEEATDGQTASSRPRSGPTSWSSSI
jgi:PleD family two-component response regulator